MSNAGSVLAASTSAVSAGAHDVHLVALGDDVGMQASGALRLVGERVSATKTLRKVAWSKSETDTLLSQMLCNYFDTHQHTSYSCMFGV